MPDANLNVLPDRRVATRPASGPPGAADGAGHFPIAVLANEVR